MRLLNIDNTAIFTSCGNNTIEPAIKSLLSTRKFLPDAKLFLISHNLSPDQLTSLKKTAIEYIDLDLRSSFIRHWRLAAEDFYFFAMPEFFYHKKYQYSIFISPSNLLLSNPFKKIKSLDSIAGIKFTNQNKDKFISDQLIFFNNHKLSSLKFLDTSVKLFKNSLDSLSPYSSPEQLFVATQKTLKEKIKPQFINRFHILKQLPQKNTKKESEPNESSIKTLVSENENLGILNFGDQVTKYLIPAIFHREISPHPGGKGVDLFATGSVLFELPNIDLDHPIYCWGSGYISAEPIPNEIDLLKHVTFTAVRGNLTLKRVRKAYPNLKIPLGDPGILANIIFPPNPNKIDRIGVVPHYIDADNPIVEKLRHDKRFFIIDPLDPPAVVAKQISSCPFVLSSSLHGLIFADSYGIPNAHVNFSNKVYGGEYKFQDYDSGVGKKHLDADIDKIFDKKYLDSLAKKYQPIKNLEKIQKNLISAFPYK